MGLILLETAEDIADRKREEWLLARRGRFTASEFHRLVAPGIVNQQFEIIGRTGCYQVFADGDLASPADEVFGTKAEAAEWIKKEKVRLGVFTLSTGAIAYVCEKVAESLTKPILDEGYTSPAMQWGIENELNAVAAIEERLGVGVENIGTNQEFIKSLCGNYGCSPDGLIDGLLSQGIEIKCPDSDTHLQYMEVKGAASLKEINSAYFWQVQGSMMVTGAKRWLFASYDPRFELENLKLHIAEIEPDEAAFELLSLKLKLAIEMRDNWIKRLTNGD